MKAGLVLLEKTFPVWLKTAFASYQSKVPEEFHRMMMMMCECFFWQMYRYPSGAIFGGIVECVWESEGRHCTVPAVQLYVRGRCWAQQDVNCISDEMESTGPSLDCVHSKANTQSKKRKKGILQKPQGSLLVRQVLMKHLDQELFHSLSNQLPTAS